MASDLYERGVTSYGQGQYQEALNYLKQALVIYREVGNRAQEGDTLSYIGGIYYSLGQYNQALENYEQALVIYREVGDQAGEEAVVDSIKSLPDN